ncbi:hypothetical protein [Janthinobacterium sp.]|uniref:hypothetical protein n=1 Tax=Janthinobacterium sp. TaxID=1871054 RepID=UPI00293D74BD|nr:hypothetical protein [Janthinobacterium sp.]
MNIAKNMEALFVSAAILVGATTIAVAAVPQSHAPVAAVAGEAAAATHMQTVVIVGKRLSAAEKAAL